MMEGSFPRRHTCEITSTKMKSGESFERGKKGETNGNERRDSLSNLLPFLNLLPPRMPQPLRRLRNQHSLLDHIDRFGSDDDEQEGRVLS